MVPPSSQDEALSRYSVSGESPAINYFPTRHRSVVGQDGGGSERQGSGAGALGEALPAA